MLFGVFGTPSPLSSWTVAALRSLVDEAHGGHVFDAPSSLADLRKAFAARDGAPMVYFSDCPEREVAQIFLDAGAPYIVCIEHPSDVIGYCARQRGMAPADALRLTSHNFACLHDLALGPHARVLRRTPELRVSQAVLELCTAFSLLSDAARAAQAVQRLTGQAELADGFVEDLLLAAYPLARPCGDPAGLTELGAPAWIGGTAECYAPLYEGSAIDAMNWPRATFLDPRTADKIVPAEQDLTGPARYLVYGPYLNLPRGAWRATANIEVDHVRANALMVDVAAWGNPLRTVRFDLPSHGKFAFSLDFEVTEPHQFLEIRFLLMNSAIEGKFHFEGVRLQRIEGAV